MKRFPPEAGHRLRTGLQWAAVGGGAIAIAYATVVAVAWLDYGRNLRAPAPEEVDPLLDHFMPRYEVVERHHVLVAAPADVTFDSACRMDLFASPVIRTIFKARERLMGASPDARIGTPGLLAETQSLGWGVLAEVADHEVVVGAVTKPWEADVTFRALPPAEFAAFDEPGFAKIVWTLRADPVNDTHSIFRTETRVVTTDAGSRAKFRRYWAFVSPGIRLIRLLLLNPLKAEAERRASNPP